MSHLTLEVLARIADGPATEEEAAHLAACEECRAELDALRDQVAALGALPAPAAPAAVWRGVEARLRAGEGDVRPARRPSAAGWLVRAAAAAAVFLAGTLTGARVGAESGRSGEMPAASSEQAAPADPADALREAETRYAEALAAYMAEHGAGDPELDPNRRLAALESIILTARAALEESPGDAVIGGYYSSAVAQREALMSQVQWVEGEGWY